MQWITKIPGVSKMVEKAGDKLKSLRRGKDRDTEKEPEPKSNETKTLEEKELENTSSPKQDAIKESTEIKQQVDEIKQQLAPVQLKEGEEEIIGPTPTPPNTETETDNGGSESYRGRVPWNDSSYQEPDINMDLDIEEEGMEI